MDIPVIERGEVPPDQKAHFFKFVCPPLFGGGPIDPQRPTRIVQRNLDVHIKLPLPQEIAQRTKARMNHVPLWIIEDPKSRENGRTFPSPIIRTVQGDVVHAKVGFKLASHTIHWHGIEPTPLNDGVGHTSFESTSNFVYQFATNTPGTYIYHCHKNTVLHFEMGLYGLFVVDPPNPNPKDRLKAPYPTGGPGFAPANLSNFPGFPGFDPQNFVVRYDVEGLWVPDEMDSLWHQLQHNAFMQKCNKNEPMDRETFTTDGILNNFRPDIFVVTGVPSVPETPQGVQPEIGKTILDPRVKITARANQTILIRLAHAGYEVHEYTLGLDAIAISSDGQAFGVPPLGQYSSPFLIPAGTPFRLTSARRLGLLLRPRTPGNFPVTIKFYDWVRNPDSRDPLLYHVANTIIQVKP